MDAAAPQAIHLEAYRAPDYRIAKVALEFDLEPEATRVRSWLNVEYAALAPGGGDVGWPMLRLDGDDLKLISIALDGVPLAPERYSLDDKALTIEVTDPNFELEIETEINPKANTRLEGLYISSGTFCTQCEAEGFRRITFFPDRPDVMSVFEVTLKADKALYPVLLSNGNLVESGDLPDGRHWTRWEDPFPKPAYLFAVVAGDLACVEDSFTTASGREVSLRIFVEHGNESRCSYGMDSLKRAMRWDEERFGLEYDLDLFNIVAVSDFNMGAMENKSLNVFNSKCVLADPDTATDADYASIEGIVAHEYFHNWTGNRVTCRDWFQLSLKEGLTVFRDQEFSADMRSAPVKRIQDVRILRARQFPEDGGPTAHPVRPASYIEINNFYTATVYDKGAEVIRMMQGLLGREGFRKGMDLYFERHDGQAVTCDDFAAAMSDATGVDLSQFKLWYSQAGTPKVSVESNYNAADSSFELTLSQEVPETPGQSGKKPMHIPLELALLDSAGQPLPLQVAGERGAPESRVLELREGSQTFRFENLKTAPAVSINRSFSAPVNLSIEHSPEARAVLMAHDSDSFNRWETGQQYATRLLLDAVAQRQKGLEVPPAPDGFIAALKTTLKDETQDAAFRALALTLPTEAFLADQMAVVDVEGIHTVREAMRRNIAKELGEDLLATYRSMQTNTPFEPTAEAAGRRALKNVALAYLTASHEPKMLELAVAQSRNTDNMTDRMAALSLLTDTDAPAREVCLEAFYQRYKDDALVVDKWLSLEAMSVLPGTLKRVEDLLQHEAFSLTNPNKVRALIGVFAAGNPLCFHQADGSGYRFLAERIVELDRINPQAAARLVAPLGRWSRYDAGRQNLMRAALESILAAGELSPDVYELTSKSLT
ncbi:aminopeptidase N [Pelagibius sp. Alg239-R121]|uniref:aminopeptidase N n=1 Tax=Pelagibius sp. Alg239-R121 TaxID=2993448 RepID=UPI0024A79D74|nr:aminopeptidase N [Pelagibius sp. Alg239-R121]